MNLPRQFFFSSNIKATKNFSFLFNFPVDLNRQPYCFTLPLAPPVSRLGTILQFKQFLLPVLPLAGYIPIRKTFEVYETEGYLPHFEGLYNIIYSL